jgi:hypothetical protein
MSTARLRDLQASLRRELSRQTQERGLGPPGRVVWLIDQLEHYVERWVGLRQTTSQPFAPLGDDLFLMVEVGAEAVSEELRAVESPAAAERWQGFLAELAVVRSGCDASAQQLPKSLALVRSSLSP